MRSRYLLLAFAVTLLFSVLNAQSLSIASWNIRDLGKTKSPEEIIAIARIINQFDIVGVQEVVAKDPGGAKAVAKIADELNRMGSRWDYRLSDPTRSSSSHLSERYAYFWRSSKVQFLSADLDNQLALQVEREPYWLKVRVDDFIDPIYLINFHSRPYNQQPESEITLFQTYPQRAKGLPLIFLGDWNLDEEHPVWIPFQAMSYLPAVVKTPTTLKRNCKAGNYRNHSIDNIYYPSQYFELESSGVIDFINGDCINLPKLRHLSDHLPVFVVLKL